ncbi:pyrroline-5-carboxylate reductase [Nesterenkonia natronophila]|uniref:Pyrroline-5-carboxylate reductase n=1 Tax=Nesterenkonia natronophila TaxID=2174932 RepID=A0A3A4F2Q9_9MICC|nr:pyrroline-5-carboxylate reductase [Nesterenkonia natronophila]RJN32592.1 pyrroline-5-carboxylate reductase [Nesterenkonia natronophila]
MTKIAMLGLGSMNGAVLSGLLASGVSAEDVVGTSRSAESAQQRSQQYGVTVLAEEHDAAANTTAAAQADVVFLGVKPHQVVDLCAEIKEALRPHTVVVSVAAAVTIAMMESALAERQPVIRAMPNTPMSVGAGVVGLAASSAVSPQQTQTVAQLLGASGSVHVLEEEQIDALTGVAGSGPAYTFYLAEHMAAAGVEMGLDPELAADLAAQTVYGAGKMLIENRGDNDVAQLRRNVTSPNGTTQRAIETFDAAQMGATIRAGAQASAARAAEITAQLQG